MRAAATICRSNLSHSVKRTANDFRRVLVFCIVLSEWMAYAIDLQAT